jgi:hypothetical protein
MFYDVFKEEMAVGGQRQQIDEWIDRLYLGVWQIGRPLVWSISEETGVSRRLIKMIVAAINISDRRFRQ